MKAEDALVMLRVVAFYCEIENPGFNRWVVKRSFLTETFALDDRSYGRALKEILIVLSLVSVCDFAVEVVV
jgi:hypothetical protein